MNRSGIVLVHHPLYLTEKDIKGLKQNLRSPGQTGSACYEIVG